MALSCEVLSTPDSHFCRLLEIVVKTGAHDFDFSVGDTSERGVGRNGPSPLPRPAQLWHPHFHPLLCVSTAMCCRDPAAASVRPCVTPLPTPVGHADPASPCPSLWSHIVWPQRLLSSPPVPFWSLLFPRPACMPCSDLLNLSCHQAKRMWLFLVMSFLKIGMQFA